MHAHFKKLAQPFVFLSTNEGREPTSIRPRSCDFRRDLEKSAITASVAFLGSPACPRHRIWLNAGEVFPGKLYVGIPEVPASSPDGILMRLKFTRPGGRLGDGWCSFEKLARALRFDERPSCKAPQLGSGDRVYELGFGAMKRMLVSVNCRLTQLIETRKSRT